MRRIHRIRPRRARIKAQRVVDLEVQQQHVDGDRPVLVGCGTGRQFHRASERDRRIRIAVIVPRVIRGLGVAQEVIRAAVLEGHRHIGVGCRGNRHVIAVRVVVDRIQAVTRIGRIQAAQDLPAVAHAVTVGVPMQRVGAAHQLLIIGQAVVVQIALFHAVGGRHARVEFQIDVFPRDRFALADVQRVIAHAVGLVDHRVVPEEILPAVRIAVSVGIHLGRVGRTLRALRRRIGLRSDE